MSRPEPIEPSDPQAEGDDAPTPQRPDWLVGADEGADPQGSGADPSRETAGGPRRPVVPTQRRQPAPSHERVPAEDTPPPAPEAPAAEPAAAGGPVAWKAAASSVPKLRQQPAAASQDLAPESFPGFAQDAMVAKGAATGGARGTDSVPDALDAGPDDDVVPLAEDSPFWVEWLDRLRMLPRPAMIGAGAVVLIGVATVLFWPRGTPGVSLAQIRQQPEAFEGRSVRVGGRAGETFSIGGSYVFHLVQGRDTIVVYSRSWRPRLHEKVAVDGVVSIGYLEGVPRVAVLATP